MRERERGRKRQRERETERERGRERERIYAKTTGLSPFISATDGNIITPRTDQCA